MSKIIFCCLKKKLVFFTILNLIMDFYHSNKYRLGLTNMNRTVACGVRRCGGKLEQFLGKLFVNSGVEDWTMLCEVVVCLVSTCCV